MTGEQGQERVERVLRAVFAEQAADRTPPAGLADRVRRHNRLRRRALVSAAAAAAVLVAGGVPAGLTLARADRAPAGPAADPTGPRPVWQDPGPAPTGDPCVLVPAKVLPAPVPAARLPRQSGVRGSLGADEALVDRVLVAAWQGFGVRPSVGPAPAWDARTLRVQFVERAEAGVLGLVAVRDRAGLHGSMWVAGRDRWLVPIGGETEEPTGMPPAALGDLFWGDDPLLVGTRQVCGRTVGVVLAPPGSTATVTTPVRIGADARPERPPARIPVPLVDGLAVFPAEAPASTRVVVSPPGGDTVSRALDLEVHGYDTTQLVSPAQIEDAVRTGGGTPDRSLVRLLVEQSAGELFQSVAGRVTAVRVPWGGPLPDGRHAALTALTLPSGAVYVAGATREGTSYDGFYTGLLPAGQLDGTVLSWRHPDGTVVVVAPGAVRAEVVLSDDSVRAVPLAGGGGSVRLPGVTLVRAYRADGSPLTPRAPDAPLTPLPREE